MADEGLGGTAAPRHRLTAAPAVAFWLVAYLFAAAMLGNTMPTPLYVIYQARWGFSSGMITLIFATYAVGVLAALLLAGRASDQVGRRPVLGAALGLSAVSSLAFIFASGLGWLFAGRVLSGLSAGLITGTATAALSDLAGPLHLGRASTVATAATTGGLGLGPLVAGLLAEHAPNPTVLTFEVHLLLLAVAALGLVVVPETVSSRGTFALRFAGFRIPSPARRQFLAAGAAGFAALGLLGLFAALAPSFLRGVLGVTSYSIGGLVVFLTFAVSTVTQIALGKRPHEKSLRLGLGVFIVALALLVTALERVSFELFMVATIIAGAGVGAAFIGTLGIANRVAPPDIRGQVMSTYFTFSYAGLTVPVIAVGFAADRIGFFRAVLACSAGLALICVLSFLLARRMGAEPAATR